MTGMCAGLTGCWPRLLRRSSAICAGCILCMLPVAGWASSALAAQAPFAPLEPGSSALPESSEASGASATAYEGLSASQAQQLAQETFPEMLASEAAPSLPVGARIAAYRGPEVAQLSFVNGGRGVLQAASPIAAPEASGGWMPIDLSLEESSGAWQPAHADVQVRIPRDLREGVVLPGSRVSLLPLGAQGTEPASGEGVLDGAGIFYAGASVGTDTDVAVKPTSTGFEEDTVLRSQRSPSVLFFAIGLPAGAQLVQSQESGSIEVLQNGTTIATVLPIQARDAFGALVPTTTTVQGDVVSVSVADTTGAVVYPVSVDPAIDKEAKLAKGAEHGNWVFSTTNSLAFSGSIASDTLTDQDLGSRSFTSGENGLFGYTTQKESRIYQLAGNLKEDNGGSEAVQNELILGHEVINAKEEKEYKTEAKTRFTPHSTEYTVPGAKVCLETSCGPAAVSGSPGNTAIFEQNAIANGSSFSSDLESAAVYINQEKAPTAKFDTTDTTIEGRPNPLIAGNWLSTKMGAPDYVAIDATDPGIGIDAQSLSSPNKAGWSIATSKTAQNDCEGAQCDECYETTCANEGVSGKPLTLPLSGASSGELPEGEDTLEAKVEDASGLSAKASAKVHVDNAPPYNIKVTGLPPGDSIAETAYHVTVSATDGSGSVESSGVESIKVQIGGVTLESPSGGCSPGPCTATGHWTIDGWKYSDGPHALTIVATDRAGNVTEENLTLTIHRAEPVAIGPGSVDPVTGRFDLTSKDVSIATGGPELSVGRTYDSRQPTLGATGPLGPQWSMNMGSSESLVEGFGGAMVLSPPPEPSRPSPATAKAASPRRRGTQTSASRKNSSNSSASTSSPIRARTPQPPSRCRTTGLCSPPAAIRANKH